MGKRNRVYDLVVQLFKSLTNREISLLEAKLKSTESSKSMALHNLLCDNIEYSDDELRVRLEYDSNSSAYSLLKRRYMDDCLEVVRLVGDERHFKSKRIYVKQKVIGELRNVDVCLSRGLEDVANDILTKIIAKAEKYQLYSELVLMYEKKLSVSVVRGALKSEELYERLKEYQAEVENIHRARRIYYDLVSKQGRAPTLIESLQRMSTIAKTSKADEVSMLKARTSIYVNTKTRNYDAAVSDAISFIDISQHSQVVGSVDSVAGGYYMLALVQTTASKYDDALNSLKVSESLFKKNSVNRIKAKELELVCQVNSGETLAFKNSLGAIIQSNSSSAYFEKFRDIWSSIDLLFTSNTDFLSHVNRTSVLKKLGQSDALYMRLLEAIVLFKEGDFEIAKARLSGLQRNVQDVRLRIAIQAMNELVAGMLSKSNIDANKVIDRYSVQFSEIDDWDPSGYEKIRFENILKMLDSEV